MLLLQRGSTNQTPQEEMWPDIATGNNGIIVGTFLWILSSPCTTSRWQTSDKTQSESRKAPSKIKPDLSLANIYFSHLGSPGLWLKEAIVSEAPGSTVCFPCLKALACESSLGAQTGKGTGLPFPSTRGLIASCHLTWLSVHTCALECFSPYSQSGIQVHWRSQTRFQD